MDKEISLLDALTGVEFTIMHLDGRVVRIQSSPGSVIKPNTMMTCEGLGMPFHKTPYKFGNLFINFKVKFPETVDDSQAQKIQEILSAQKTKTDVSGVSEVCKLQEFTEAHKNTHVQGGTRGQDSDGEEDDEDGHGG